MYRFLLQKFEENTLQFLALCRGFYIPVLFYSSRRELKRGKRENPDNISVIGLMESPPP